MIDLFTAFATGDDFFYEGAFIAKVKYERFETKKNNELYKNEIVKNNRKLCVIECSGYVDTQILEKLTVYLMMGAKVKELVNPDMPDVSENQGTLWRNFSKEEIADFSHTTGDTNSIHLTENPVVQGLFILKELCETTQADEIEVKYTHPVYGNNPVYILREENTIKGFSNGILCFQATL
jgi:hypothetical protein